MTVIVDGDGIDDLRRQVDRLVALLDKPLLYSYDDAMAKLGGIHEHTVQRLIERAELLEVVVDGRHYVTGLSVAAYVERLAAQNH